MDYIYLDHNATTPARPEVIDSMARCWRDGLANPASQHQVGQRARRVLEDARERIAAILGANLPGPRGDRLLFTSGGTEANNLAILGIAQAAIGAESETGVLAISATEHSSIIGPAERLLELGWTVHTLPVDASGVLQSNAFTERLDSEPRPSLVSVILGNHETGVLQPVEEAARLCRERGIWVHTDAVQTVGKQRVSFQALGVDAMSVAAHKFQGPIGIGALLLRHQVPFQPILFGGHQQNGLRPGTEPVPLVVGMATALELWEKDAEGHAQHLTALRNRFESGLRAGYPDLVINAEASPRLPQTSSIAFPGLDAQMLLLALDMAGVACSVGSACVSGSSELSPTLLAMGLPKSIVSSTLRFSLGATTSDEEIDEAVQRILHVVRELQS